MEKAVQLATDVWQKVLLDLESRSPRSAVRGWLKNAAPLGFDDDIFVLGVPSEFARDWLEKRASRTLRTSLQEVTQRPVEIKFVLSQMPLGLELTEATPPPAASPNRPRHSSRFNPKYTFENFVVGKSNQFAQAAAQAVAKSPGRSYNPLFLYGGAGLGKTHLMQAIGHYIVGRQKDVRVEYVSGDAFTYDVVSSIREDRFGAFRSKYRAVDVWLVDDIQFIAAKERTESEFFQTFNALHEAGRQVVISSDHPPKDLKILDPRLRSRFEWGLLADIKPPDLETRIAILEKKAEMEAAAVPTEVIRYIAEVVQSNIRVLEGALISLLAAASFTGSPLSLALAAEQLKHHSVSGRLHFITVHEIQEVVATHFRCSLEDMNGPRRTRDLVLARQVAMYLARELIHCSFPEIGREFGDKDHSTVIHSCQKIRGQLDSDSRLRTVVTELRHQLETRT